jgi:hypothetical protein
LNVLLLLFNILFLLDLSVAIVVVVVLFLDVLLLDHLLLFLLLIFVVVFHHPSSVFCSTLSRPGVRRTTSQRF